MFNSKDINAQNLHLFLEHNIKANIILSKTLLRVVLK